MNPTRARGAAFLLTLIFAGSANAGAGAQRMRLELPAPATELVTNEAAFTSFARVVSTEVERMLRVPAVVDDEATLRVVLSLRVHLAHRLADNEKAVVTAAWIRSLQTDPAARAYAGLTTLAFVEARRRHPGIPPVDAAFRRTFRDEFARLLDALPQDAGMVSYLGRQRKSIAAITEGTLLTEVRDTIGPAISRQGFCGMAEVDALVRVWHRREDLVPVRAEMLEALDAALASRVSR